MSGVDLNSDLGEGFGRWSLGDDDRMLAVVSSANVACGFHAGDPATIRRTVRAAVAHGVAIGAHVGYRDLAGFGRRAMDVPGDELRADVLYQLGALCGIAAAEGGRVAYVKPHGALYHAAAKDERVARDVAVAVGDLDPGLTMLGQPGTAALAVAADVGLRVATEAFADRAYAPDGTLLPRSAPGAVLRDPDEVARRVLRLATEGVVEAVDGSLVPVAADSVCVHGDTPGAAAMAERVREVLDAAGVPVRPFVGGAHGGAAGGAPGGAPGAADDGAATAG
ncbi:5-oxoprolinase subunit PxpA [Isoptericola hypogeus]|uniref:5-oxoprolinase subunit A n=1 Tax=Isoptericola hypogeus TaxID=300179 RepID=A0ABP4VFW2_9MICO